VRGRPLLAYWLHLLFEAGIERTLVNTHYLAEQVKSFVRASPWSERVDLVHEEQLLGTGGTVLRNRCFFGNGPFIVAHADNLTRFDVRQFIRCHESRPKDAAITMMTFDTDAPETCGIVVVDRSGVVQEMHEKVRNPPSSRANAAVYIFGPQVVEFIASLGKQVVDISTEVLPSYMGRIYAFHNSGYHRDIGSNESLRKAEAEFVP
jgi:Nucleoside-diphosphate-sugar pyrophosphorylase involved in lipopolysaccharide biosynthesis/translation initiation factor 2B, gamma/epsilon subunits (eIF-2Bgamma/eIF-2Bepsilon)